MVIKSKDVREFRKLIWAVAGLLYAIAHLITVL